MGGMALTRNNATDARTARDASAAEAFLLWQCGLILALGALVLTMTNLPNLQHTAHFAQISCAVYPGVLLAVGTASEFRWAMTGAALACTLVSGVMVWVLPLFPAHPLTAPIHNPLDHLMPPSFPLLLIVPALVGDLVRAKSPEGSGWRAQVTPFEPGPGDRLGLERVQLEIWWMSGNLRRSFGLEGFRRTVLPKAP